MYFGSKKGVCSFLILSLATIFALFGYPALAKSQETMGTPSAQPSVEPHELAPEEEPSTFADWWLELFLGDPGQDSDPTHVETFGEDSLQSPEDKSLEEDTHEEETVSEDGDNTPSFVPPPTPPLKTRRYGVELFVDPRADHSCEVETLRVDLTDQPFAFRKILLESYPGFTYSLEIGSLPDGIDVVFSDTKIHLLHMDTPLTETTVEISKQEGARKGDFSVPIIFTERGTEDSTFICQLNIANF